MCAWPLLIIRDRTLRAVPCWPLFSEIGWSESVILLPLSIWLLFDGCQRIQLKRVHHVSVRSNPIS